MKLFPYNYFFHVLSLLWIANNSLDEYEKKRIHYPAREVTRCRFTPAVESVRSKQTPYTENETNKYWTNEINARQNTIHPRLDPVDLDYFSTCDIAFGDPILHTISSIGSHLFYAAIKNNTVNSYRLGGDKSIPVQSQKYHCSNLLADGCEITDYIDTGLAVIKGIQCREIPWWDGTSVIIMPGGTVNMPVTPDGVIVISIENWSKKNNEAAVTLSSGGKRPESIIVPPFTNMPVLKINNWKTNNLMIANVSTNNHTPVHIICFGNGKEKGKTLNEFGSKITVAPFQVIKTTTTAGFMRLVIGSYQDFAVFLIYRGSVPSVYWVNTKEGSRSPDYVTCTTSGNSLNFIENFNGEDLMIVNVSPRTAVGAWIVLQDV